MQVRLPEKFGDEINPIFSGEKERIELRSNLTVRNLLNLSGRRNDCRRIIVDRAENCGGKCK